MNLCLLLIKLLHIIITLYIIFSPYIVEFIIKDNKLKIMISILYIVFSISMFVHWKANNDICCLSLLENLITGKPLNNTFISKIISPFYTINTSEIKNLSYLVLIINNIFTSFTLFKYRNLINKDFFRNEK